MPIRGFTNTNKAVGRVLTGHMPGSHFQQFLINESHFHIKFLISVYAQAHTLTAALTNESFQMNECNKRTGRDIFDCEHAVLEISFS